MFASFTRLLLTNEHFETIALSASKDSYKVEVVEESMAHGID
ncbi:hypothetical protein IC582_008265 [Cucumis melo]